MYLDVLKYVKTGSEVVIVLRVNAAAVNAHVLLLIENVTQMFVEIVGLGMSKPHLSFLLVCYVAPFTVCFFNRLVVVVMVH